MKSTSEFTKRYIIVPGATALLVMSGMAAVNAVGPENMIAEDGKVEVVDGKHVQDLMRRMPFESGESLTISNKNGKIVVSTWDKEEVEVSIRKRMEKRVGGVGWLLSKLKIPFETSADADEFFEEVTVAVHDEEDGVRVETIVPDRKPNVNVSMLYEVKLPREANLDLSTSNGSITVAGVTGRVFGHTSNGKVVMKGVDGELEVRTSNGSVECNGVSGPLRAKTSNGSIRVNYAQALGSRDEVDCRTSNGSIRMTLPEGSAFQLDASTSNGRVSTGFDVDTHGDRSSKRKLAGSVGSGGPRIELDTSNGSITVDPA